MLSKAIKFVSVSTFEIYLFAYAFDYVLYPLFLSVLDLPTQELKFVLFFFVPALSFFGASLCAFCYRRVSAFFGEIYRKRRENPDGAAKNDRQK